MRNIFSFLISILILAGCGGGSSSSVPVTPLPAGYTAPSTGVATNVTDTTATLSGNFTNPAGYSTQTWLEWGGTTSYGAIGSPTQSQYYAFPGSISPSANISGLTVNSTYHYRLCTKNADGTWCSSDKSFTTIQMAVKTTIASGLTNPVQFAVDANNVYWTQGGPTGGVYQMPLAGGAIVTLAASGVVGAPGVDATMKDPYGVAVDATSVYWTDQSGGANNTGSVKKAPIGGGTITTLYSAPAGATVNPEYIAIDANNVYFTQFGTWNTAAGMRNADGSINKMPIAGGAVTALATALNGPQTMRIDTANIYWTEVANFVGGAGTVKSVPIAGGAANTLVSGLSNSRNIAIDSAHVFYWSGYGTLSMVPLGGATATNPIVELATNMNETQPLAVDTTDVYWTESANNGTVKKFNKAASSVAVRTSVLVNPNWIVLDTANVYWLENDTFNGVSWAGTGAIKRILK